MAKIKTETYSFNGKEIKVNFNCDSKGKFSTNLNIKDYKELGIEEHFHDFDSFDELYSIINKAFYDYNNSLIEYALKIKVIFGASGEMCKDISGEFNEVFREDNGKWDVSTAFSTMRGIKSLIGFDYDIIIEKHYKGDKFYYTTQHIQGPKTNYQHETFVGDYRLVNQIWDFNNNVKILEYNETTLSNLLKIRNQLRHASNFLLNLFKLEDLNKVLSTEEIKKLE